MTAAASARRTASTRTTSTSPRRPAAESSR
jgi:hypothetical protein